jgi:hypothetical protein
MNMPPNESLTLGDNLELAKHAAARSEQIKCKRPGCTIVFLRTHHNQEYCTDEDCKIKRSSERVRAVIKDPDADNLVLAKAYESGHIILVQCHAHGVNGRCNDYYRIIFDRQRKIYPKFCPDHRNAYKRNRFQTVRMENVGKCQNLILEQSKLQTNLNSTILKSSIEEHKSANQETN